MRDTWPLLQKISFPSIPCYSADNVDRQRGKGVFDASIRGLQQLNARGYARAGSGLVLNLVYNPQRASLPPPQEDDCDFNQMLDLPLGNDGNERVHLSDLLAADLDGDPIRVAGHCYGCTAGQGSSCGGALREAAE